jgi:glutathione peroxidase
MDNVYNIGIKSISGEENFLRNFNGKVTLLVNISSKFGYTPKCSPLWSYARTARQLWQLQQIHEEFYDRGFSVIGFPCNQFGKMEPGSNSEIKTFLETNYPFMNFPISEKIDVNGKDEHPVYSFLKGKEKRNYSDTTADGTQAASDGQNLAGQAIARIPHNYEKFLISRNGIMVSRFNWQDMPLDDEPRVMGASWTIREAIDEVLG